MAFFGVWGSNREARTRFERLAFYLSRPVLHFSLDGRAAICHDGASTLEELSLPAASLFVGTASEGRVLVARSTLTALYRRYGKHLRRHITCPSAFALYDAKRGVLLLGATEGEKCYIEESHGAIFFSSARSLLRAPVPIDFALLK